MRYFSAARKTTRTLALIACCHAIDVWAIELEEGSVYKTKIQLNVMPVKSRTASTHLSAKTVNAHSKFEVLDSSKKDVYLIQFEKIYKNDIINGDQNYAEENVPYYIDRRFDYGRDKQVDLEKLVNKSFAGFVSGTLVVPFKYRVDDHSISGESTLGYYAGYGFDISTIAVTPFLSAGLTQVAVASLNNGEATNKNKSGFTWAAGFLLQNWDKLNIGLVYGRDLIGDQQWEHENQGWWSLSVGWGIKG